MLSKISKKLFQPLYYLTKLAVRYRDPRFIFSCVITRNIPKSTIIPHPIGIVIGKANGVTLGERCIIMQGVTLGVKNIGDINGPRIGNDVLIGANAVVVGDIEIGDNVKIGANSFVNFNVNSNSIIINSEIIK